MTSFGLEVDSRYEQIEELDRAGLTALYRARHRVLGAHHILRVLRCDVGDSLRGLFLERARAQARLRHVAWVRVHNVFEEPGCVVVASDATEGESLATVLARGALDPEVAARVVATLAEALDELHRSSLVHHELRPGMVRVDPLLNAPRITQLSLRFQVEREGDAVPYASPEELVTPGSGDARADVHALGALLHHLVAGAPPFPVEARGAALVRRLGGARPAQIYDGALASIVSECLNDRPEDRPRSAATLATRLRGWAEARAVVAPDAVAAAPVVPSLVEDPPKPVRRRGKGGAIAGAGVVVVAVLAVAAAITGFVGWRAWCRAESVALTADAFNTLRRYKTDAVANDDAALLSNALVVATKAVARDPSPPALGVRALAYAWVGGWHLANAKWDEARFREADALTRAATVGGQPEAWFARGLVLAGGCKLVDVGDPRRSAWCSDADDAYARALPELAGAGLGWLRFEVLWSQAANGNQAALSGRRLGDAAAEARGWTASLTACDQGYALLAEAPVNDRELAQECVTAAGGLGRYDLYFMWARFLQADDIGDDGKLKNTNVESIYRGARPACVTLHFERRKKKSLPETQKNTELQFCYAAGLRALGCADAASVVIQGNQVRDPSLPWAALAQGQGGDRCYLDLP